MEHERPVWPVMRQLTDGDPLALGSAAQSETTRKWRGRIAGAKVTKSVCPFCAVGCGQLLYVKDEQLIQIEGDPDSPISRGRLCPKGSASKNLVTSKLRQHRVKYRPPHGADWQELGLDEAMDIIADRVIETRRRTWQQVDSQDRTLRRSLGVVNLGGATLDNEENYTIKKLMTALGFVQVENQARI